MRPLTVPSVLAAAVMVLSTACSNGGSDDPSGAGGSGGSSTNPSGGTISSGGNGSGGNGSGGLSSSGGSSAKGGTTSTGGSAGSGGSAGRGGTTTGGTSGSRGTTVKGGASGSGGSAAGGTIARGGSSGSGGAATGGTTAKGGTSGSGGAHATGGTSGSGGTTSTSTAPKFSFFVVSYAALQKIAGNTKGLGGDLRHGETGAGAGLRGADKICAEIAEGSLAGAGAKTWRAFLSATADENGKQVNAIDRIGNGPWYDRLGRLLANSRDELYYDRPKNADAAIKMDFPNENGVTNQNPDKTGNVDNHDMLTGSDDQGRLYGATSTCSDWTTAVATSGHKPRVGHSWPTIANQCSTTSTLGTGSGGASGSGGMGGGWPGGPGGGIGSLCNWMSALDESGCAPGVNLIQNGGPGNDGTVGSGGGYGGFYCFALTP